MSTFTSALKFRSRFRVDRVLKVRAAASQILLRTTQHWIARYRQICFAARGLQRLADIGRQGELFFRIHLDRKWLSARPEGFDAETLQTGGPTASQWVHAEHRHQFHAEGYVVIRRVVPPALVRNAVREIAAFVGADLHNGATWYGGAPELDGIVPLHHAQSLWDIRQCSNLYQVFAEFFGTPRLMVDMNRCIFRPPVRPGLPGSYGSIHWDTDPRARLPASVQGVVLLTDVARDGGGFQCLPEVYQNLDVWLDRYAMKDDFDFFNPGLNDWKATQIEGRAGDVIIWSTKLPHGSAANLSNTPRIAAFVSMQPPVSDPGLRDAMQEWWLEKRAPDHWRGLPGQLDPEPGAPATLSELGLKLIGVLPW